MLSPHGSPGWIIERVEARAILSPYGSPGWSIESGGSSDIATE